MGKAIRVPDDVRDGFTGALLAPEHAGYEQARQVHNGLVDKRPALIARCAGTADVASAVRLGRDRADEISVRGGGHGVAGRAVTEGGLMIDLAPMKGIRVEPRRRTVWAQGGVTWRELNRAAAEHGLATTGGVVSTTGVGGLTLGGGEGWLMGRYGLAVDNLLSVALVTADGSVVVADDETDADLFWAVRGGGGNFGVAAAFEFRAHPVPTVLGGMVAHPLARAVQVFELFREVVATSHDELTTYFAMTHEPDGSRSERAALVVCHCGADPARAEAEIKVIRDFGPPVLAEVDRMPYPMVNRMMDDAFPRGARSYWKSALLRAPSAEPVRLLAEAFGRCPSPMSAVVLIPYHGAVTRVPVTATAFPHRDESLSLVIMSQWEDPAADERNIGWARETFDALRPHVVDRAYVNNLDADDAQLVQAAWGPNYDRLLALKRRYDPDNVFRLNHNIDPAG